MQTVIGVRFKQTGKIYHFAPGDLEIKQGDDVIVETARGMEFGHVVLGPREIPEENVTLPLKAVYRLATDEDREKLKSNKEQEKEAFRLCEEKIRQHELPMKLVGVEYTFDVNKIIFYFTADGRIDFRELVKDLAAVFRTRIELRQIGVRDEAKLLGGIGCCGRPLCCATFLSEFVPVSIRMAKEQNLSLNPTKISGICGRLMCCLKYESECYADGEGGCRHKKLLQTPHQGARVVTVEGEGKVINLNQQRRTATILLDDSKTIVASWEDIIEKEEDPENIAALAAVAEMQSEDGNARMQREHRSRRPRGERGHREMQEGQNESGNSENRLPRERRERRPRGERRERQREEQQGEEGQREHRFRRDRRRFADRNENGERREYGEKTENNGQPAVPAGMNPPAPTNGENNGSSTSQGE